MRHPSNLSLAELRALPEIVTADQIRRDVRCPRLPRDFPFALIRRPGHWLEKPVAFPTLDDLATAIRRERAGAPIQMVNAPLKIYGEAEARRGVSIWTLSDTGDRDTFIGWAWLGGGDWRALREAVFAADPQRSAAA